MRKRVQLSRIRRWISGAIGVSCLSAATFGLEISAEAEPQTPRVFTNQQLVDAWSSQAQLNLRQAEI